jgi:uncharacterized protein (TIGR03790 family)
VKTVKMKSDSKKTRICFEVLRVASRLYVSRFTHHASRIAFHIIFSLLIASPCLAGTGAEVIVIYNKRVPESKSVAEHYASRRQVPTNQIFGFDLPTSETISRAEFRDSLQKPLAKLLEQKKLWHIAAQIFPGTNNSRGNVEWRVVDSKIRYAVLCYGVPSRITRDPSVVEPETKTLTAELRPRNEAAVDNELAVLPLIEQKVPLTGPLGNPLFSVTNAALMHPTNRVLIVARLDGPSADIARGLVDKAIEAETNGLWGRAYFDLRSITNSEMKPGDEWIRAAAGISQLYGFETVVDQSAETFPAGFPMSHIALYAGWYDGNVSGPFAQPKVEFMPGAFAYHLHSFSAATLHSSHQNWVAPLLAQGVTATMGCVDEPYLAGTPDIGMFFGRFLIYGFDFGEAAYACQQVLSWQTTVVGDPLYRPFGKDPLALHQQLEKRGNKFVEWSHLQQVNLNLIRNVPLRESGAYLEQIDLTKKSAVLTEKLADLYAAQGKPSSTILTYEKALKLDPSLQQQIRLRLKLGEKLLEQNRDEDAYQNYKKLAQEFPGYPDKLSVVQKLLSLASKLGKKEDAADFEAQIKKLSAPASK